MYFSLKLFDRSVWVQKIPILGAVMPENIPFEKFVLDTRYTLNLIFLTTMVTVLGVCVYTLLSWLTKSEELTAIIHLINKRKVEIAPVKREPITIEPEN
jgi:hypothetical protein